MIKNAIIYRLPAAWIAVLADVETALAVLPFTPCGATQEKSIGWVPPREPGGAMVESVGGQWIIKLMIETKAVPGAVLKRKVGELSDRIKESTGHKPGKKALRELKDEARLELLPQAFEKRSAVVIWIDPTAKLMVLDTSSQSKADEALTALSRTLEGFTAHPLVTVNSPSASMTVWLHDSEPPPDFTIDRDCQLDANDESKAAVRYARGPLDTEEVIKHIKHGKVANMLAMTYNARLSFILNHKGVIKGIDYLGGIMETQTADVDSFDGNVTLATGELGEFIPALIAALGGEIQPEVELPLEGGSNRPEASNDELYEAAIAVVKKENRASISMVQRHLKIGYNRAARLIEDMETRGVVSPMDGAGVRKVLAA